MRGPTVCETRWSKTLASFDKHQGELVTAYKGAEEDISLIRAALVQIGSLIRNFPAKNGNGAAWKELTTKAETEKMVLCKHLEGKTLITAILRLYVATHREMVETLVQEVEDTPETKEEFREQRRRKRSSSDGQATQAKKIQYWPNQPKSRRQGRTSAA
jgi:predicted acyl esterase